MAVERGMGLTHSFSLPPLSPSGPGIWTNTLSLIIFFGITFLLDSSIKDTRCGSCALFSPSVPPRWSHTDWCIYPHGLDWHISAMTRQCCVMRFWLDFIYLARLQGVTRQMWCFWHQMWSGACFPSVEPLQCLAGCQPGSASGGMEEPPVYSLPVCACNSPMCICCACIHVWGLCGTAWNTCDTYRHFSIHPIIIWYQWILKCHNIHTHCSDFLPLMCAAVECVCRSGQQLEEDPLPGEPRLWCGLRSTGEGIRWVLMRDKV